jgi:hypothetical protein
MTEQTDDNTTPSTEAKPDRGPFGSVKEAEEHKPASDKVRLYTVTRPDGTTCYLWGHGNSDSCLAYVARVDGYKASRAGGASKEKLAGMLAAMSDEERAELLSQYAPTPKGKSKGK